MKTGTLYIVGTPIGNLEDISQRAVRVLKEVALIAAEDTRHTRKLLSHFDVHTPLESYHKFNEKEKIPKLLRLLSGGKDIAVVSSAGMPGISDPGALVVREAVSNGVRVVPVPGPAALILALVVSGLPADRFVFEGFLPKKKGLRIKRLYSLKEEERTIIFYEAGQRLVSSLGSMQKMLGDRRVVVARELTKKFEEIMRGKFSSILRDLSEKAALKDGEKPVKGEFTIVVEGCVREKVIPKKSLKEEVESLQKQLGISSKEAIKLTSARYNIPKRKVYGTYHKD